MLPTRRVVVPAAVAVVVYPPSQLLPVMFALASRNVRVDAVAAVATPVPLDAPLITGVAIVGVVPNTRAPVPVSSVIALIRLVELGVAKNVATPVPSPVTPVAIGTVIVILALPSKETPLIVLGVASAVAVEEFPAMLLFTEF